MEIVRGKMFYKKTHGENRPSLLNLSQVLFPDEGVKAESLVEITGSTDCCGKTQLLLEIIIKTILPATHGGKSGSVIFYNLDHQFNKSFFERMLRKYITNSNDVIVEECWQRLHIVNIFIAAELQVQLKSLDETVLLNNKNVSLVALDSLGAYYHLEDDDITMYQHYKKMIEQLRLIARNHQIVVAYTLPYFYQPKYDGSFTMSNYRFHITPIDQEETDSARKVNIQLSTCGAIYKIDATFSSQGLVM